MQQSDDNPITRLQFAVCEVNRVLGEGYAQQHPENPDWHVMYDDGLYP